MEDQARASKISLSGTQDVQRLLIVRLSAMGDVLHALPAVAALREVLPHAIIGWVIEERWAELLCSPEASRDGVRSQQRPLVDFVHTVDTRAWREALFSDATWSAARSSVTVMRSSQYDVALDFQGAIRSAVLARLSGAPVVYGFAQPRENAASMFYTRQVQATGLHVVEQNFSLGRAFVGQDLPIVAAKLPRYEPAEKSLADKLKVIAADYAILNPGAGWGAKQWPAHRYGEVARLLAEQTGLRSVINSGPGEEELAGAVELASAGAAKGIVTSISELIALTRGARLFIGGDTGPMHLAALLRVPVVAIFGPTNPARNGPFKTRSAVLRNVTSVTSHARVQHPEQGMLEITAGDVVRAAIELLGQTHD
jgi:lipopolysaccharide heptosyltransferase I